MYYFCIVNNCWKSGSLWTDYTDILPRALSHCSGEILSLAPSNRIPKSVQLGHHVVDLNSCTALGFYSSELISFNTLLHKSDLSQYTSQLFERTRKNEVSMLARAGYQLEGQRFYNLPSCNSGGNRWLTIITDI